MTKKELSYTEQAEAFAKKHEILLKEIGEPEYKKYFDKDKDYRWVFKLQLVRNKKRYTFTFGQSIAAGSESPTMYDVLACLTKYDPGTFENFCEDFGCDTDSRTAERTYKAVVKEWEAVERLFGDILEELQEIN